jgi:hypothetical protein
MTSLSSSERAAIQTYVDRRNILFDRARIEQAQSGANMRMESGYNPFEPRFPKIQKRVRRYRWDW